MCQGSPNMPKSTTAPYGPKPLANGVTPTYSGQFGAGAGSQLNPHQTTQSPFVYQGYGGNGYASPWGANWGYNQVGNPAGTPEVQANPVATQQNVAQPQANQQATTTTGTTTGTTNTGNTGGGKVPRVRTEIVTGGKDVYRKALSSELKKNGQLRNGVGVI